MINEKDIRRIVDDCKAAGYDVRVRDIAYVLLKNYFADENLVYGTLFTNAVQPCRTYEAETRIKYLHNYMKLNTKGKVSKKDVTMTFDENRDAMIDIIKQTELAMQSGEIDKKDGLKIIADIRVKLNDKFAVKEDNKEQIVVVEKKYNHICERFGIECFQPTIEDLKEMYNLTEKE